MERLKNKMLCDNCNKQDPIIKITVITNEKSISVYLCEECLEQLKLNSTIKIKRIVFINKNCELNQLNYNQKTC